MNKDTQSWSNSNLTEMEELLQKVQRLQRENDALRALVDHAETLLCNSLPMAHCSQVNWDKIIRKWRDQKHAINVNDALAKEAKP